jgi:hypothetical protein
MHKACVSRHVPQALVHCPLSKETAMNHKKLPPQQQTALPLSGEAHWTQLPREVREQCRTLVVELLTQLAQQPRAGGRDDER